MHAPIALKRKDYYYYPFLIHAHDKRRRYSIILQKAALVLLVLLARNFIEAISNVYLAYTVTCAGHLFDQSVLYRSQTGLIPSHLKG